MVQTQGRPRAWLGIAYHYQEGEGLKARRTTEEPNGTEEPNAEEPQMQKNQPNGRPRSISTKGDNKRCY